MRRNNNYLLREISGVPYLLPCGQKIADYRRGCKINKTGAYLWQLLEKDTTQEELLAAIGTHYQATPEELPLLQKDMDQFLSFLKTCHMLADEEFPSHKDSPGKYIKAGNLFLKLIGSAQAFSEQFDLFFCEEPDTVHQTIFLRYGRPLFHINGSLVLRSDDLTIIDAGSHYILLFPTLECILEVYLSKDGRLADIYCMPPFTDTFREELFHTVRFAFLYLAQQHHMVVLHSASFLYRDRAWLFSGHSGAGKSTHTNLWHELLQVHLLNGDLNLLAWENDRPVIHGTPWCGTSGISDPGTYLLGGIVLLRQSAEDSVEDLSPDEKRLLVLQRLISPSWTPEQLNGNLDFVDKLADHIYIAKLYCTKEFTAVKTMQRSIDQYLDSLPL